MVVNDRNQMPANLKCLPSGSLGKELLTLMYKDACNCPSHLCAAFSFKEDESVSTFLEFPCEFP